MLYNLVLFVLLLSVGAIFLGAASASQDAKIVVDLGLSATLLFGAFIAIFVGVGLVWKEIERRTVYAIFAKPVGRGEFLLGKYLGLCVTLAVNVAVMGVGVTLVLVYVVRGTTPLLLALWPTAALIYLRADDPHGGRAAVLLVLVADLRRVRLARRLRHRPLHRRSQGLRRALRRRRRPGRADRALLRAAEPVHLQPDHAGRVRHRAAGRASGRRRSPTRWPGTWRCWRGRCCSSRGGTSSEADAWRCHARARARVRRQRGDRPRARRRAARRCGRPSPTRRPTWPPRPPVASPSASAGWPPTGTGSTRCSTSGARSRSRRTRAGSTSSRRWSSTASRPSIPACSSACST